MTPALRPLRRPALWIGVWLAMIACVVVGSLLPAGDLPAPAFPGIDKLEHLVGYALLSAWAAMLFATRRALWTAGIALVALGIAIELAQGAFTTTREADALDVLANASGVALGLLVARTPCARLLSRIDMRSRA